MRVVWVISKKHSNQFVSPQHAHMALLTLICGLPPPPAAQTIREFRVLVASCPTSVGQDAAKTSNLRIFSLNVRPTELAKSQVGTGMQGWNFLC